LTRSCSNLWTHTLATALRPWLKPCAPGATSNGNTASLRPGPRLHRDPFGRLLLAQAEREGLLLLTADAVVAGYSGPVRHQHSS